MTFSQNPELRTMASLAGKRAPRSFKAGEIIFQDGDPGNTFYGVLQGEIELSWGGDRVETIGPGSSFGAGALADPGHRRFGTATATADSELLEMDRQEFLFALQELPMFGLEVLHDLEMRLQTLKQSLTTS